MPDNKIIKHFKGIIKTLLELYGNSMCSSKDHFRSTSTTLGATDFSSAVSYGRRRVGLRPTPKIPAAREKNLWYPGYTSTEINIFKNGRWNETISIVRYIEAYIGTCPLLSPPPPRQVLLRYIDI